MKTCKHFFVGRLWLFALLICVIFLMMGIVELADQNWVGYGSLIIGVVFLVISVFFPQFHVIDDKGIRIYYFFCRKEEFLWENIKKVEVDYRTRTNGFWLDNILRIYGKSEGRQYFFMDASISRTLRAQKLIEHYTGKRIEGYLIDDIRAFFRKRREKRENAGPDLSEVRNTERQVRDVVRDAAEGCQVRYYYISDDGKSNSMPRQNCTYYAQIDTDSDSFQIPLLHVRAGAKAYKCKLHDNAPEALAEKIFTLVL